MAKMGVDPEQTKDAKPVPGNQWYKLKLKSLTVKMSKSKKGYNYQAYLNVVENKTEYNDSFVMFQANNGFNQAKDMFDFCHGFGLELEKNGHIPGDWKLKDAAKPDDFDGAQYSGPLLGRVTEAELVIDNFEGTERNKVKQFRCVVKDCPVKYPESKHRTDMIGKK